MITNHWSLYQLILILHTTISPKYLSFKANNIEFSAKPGSSNANMITHSYCSSLTLSMRIDSSGSILVVSVSVDQRNNRGLKHYLCKASFQVPANRSYSCYDWHAFPFVSEGPSYSVRFVKTTLKIEINGDPEEIKQMKFSKAPHHCWVYV